MRELVLTLVGITIAGLLAILVYQNYYRFHRPQITTTWQAVTLQNGSVFYGRIAHLGSDHPVLRDAFTVRSETDPQTGQPRSVLVRRRDGPHGADHMIFPSAAIASVEPVQPDSEVGRLIAGLGAGR